MDVHVYVCVLLSLLCCLYHRSYVLELVQQRLATPKDSSSLLQDLYDGSEYRRHKEFLSCTILFYSC